MVSKDMLSQDEIDALLRGDNPEPQEELAVEDYLNSIQEDALGEIGNISFGSSATALSTLLNQKVDITTPNVTVVLKKDLAEEFPHPYVAISVNYTEGFSGMNLLVIKQSDAAVIADLMLGGDGTNPPEMLDEIQLSAVQEAMNQMMGSAATSMSTIFSKKVDISPPAIDILNLSDGEGAETIPDHDIFVKISFRLKIGDLIDSNIMQLLQLDFAKSLVDSLLNPSAEPAEPPVPAQEEAPRPEPALAPPVQPSYAEQNSAPAPSYAPPQPQRQQSTPQHFGSSYSGAQPNVQPAVFF